VVQAIVAVAVLLFDAGVITAPAPRPRYEQPQYGQYGVPGPYYGQPHQPGPPHQQGPQLQQQRPGYPPPYGGGYPGGPSAGGFPAGQQGGPPTPPSGFPHLRAAAVQQRADHTGAGAAAIVGIGAERPSAVVVWAARASTSRA